MAYIKATTQCLMPIAITVKNGTLKIERNMIILLGVKTSCCTLKCQWIESNITKSLIVQTHKLKGHIQSSFGSNGIQNGQF